MTPAEQAIECIEAAGGLLAVHGERIRCRLPEDAAHLLEELLAHRDEVLLVLRQRDDVPAMPAGVRLVQWKLKEPPLLIETCAVVTDPALFATTTLRQLQIALKNPKRWVGWTVPPLIERLAQVGVVVTLSRKAGSNDS
jgi:hypothetical protein